MRVPTIRHAQWRGPIPGLTYCLSPPVTNALFFSPTRPRPLLPPTASARSPPVAPPPTTSSRPPSPVGRVRIVNAPPSHDRLGSSPPTRASANGPRRACREVLRPPDPDDPAVPVEQAHHGARRPSSTERPAAHRRFSTPAPSTTSIDASVCRPGRPAVATGRTDSPTVMLRPDPSPTAPAPRPTGGSSPPLSRVAGRGQGARAKTLPGLKMPAGSRACLIARCIPSTTRADLLAPGPALEQADAVLAGDGAAERDRLVDDAVEGLLARVPCRVVVRGVIIRGWRLPSPAWATLAMWMSCSSAIALDAGEHLRDQHARHADVLGEHRAQPFHGRVGQPARGEQRLGLLLVGRAGCSTSRRPPRSRPGSRPPPPRRPGRESRLRPSSSTSPSSASPMCFHSSTARRQCRSMSSRAHGDDSGGRDRGDRLAGGDERVEVADDRALGGRVRPQPYGDLGDDAQGALGADHQARQVVPGDALRGTAAEPYDARRGRRPPPCRARSRG